ncbi:hypothetical protein [Bacillus sp. HSf4]|uniref:hypothetical protein n=1 Tax=Bacillus sp. HSf4 TaxID=3035514 RepID=UPI0024095048|nr:hypothetical protein [Bacillus sp. HSf4]WFA07076.1 hypothetical protein P3X63_10040 [Bacillus sp. HSf4]
MKKAEDKDKKLVEYYEDRLKKLFLTRKQLNDYLRKKNTKIQEVVICDDMFVEYPYYIKTKEGGIKEGGTRYWKAALKLHMKRVYRIGFSLIFHSLYYENFLTNLFRYIPSLCYNS